MTPEEAREILGSDICAQIDAWRPPPLSDEQIAALLPLLDPPGNSAHGAA